MLKLTPECKRALKEVELSAGKHSSFEKGACVMEMVSYIAAEPWSDRPRCACPVLTGYAIRVNDNSEHKERQRLMPFVVRLVNTRDANYVARAEFLAHASFTRILPLLTDALGLRSISKRLRQFKIGEWGEAEIYIRSQIDVIRKAAYAAANAANAANTAAAYANTTAADPKWKEVKTAIIDEQFALLDEAIEIRSKK